MAQFSKKYYLFLLVFLGFLSAFGPFVTDMYLPTLPALADIFNTSPSMVQMGLATSMIGLAVGQFFFGPLSDKYGRRPILIASLAIFAVSTVICIFSPTIEFFNAMRFLQGLGGSGGIVLARSISTDAYSGRDLAKMLGIIGAIVGIAPVIAPVIGGLVAESIGWKGIFWILFGLGIYLLAMCIIFRETHLPEKRYKGSVASLIKGFIRILHLRYYVIYALLFGFASGVLFAYVASAAFVIQDIFGYSELAFSLFFGVNASGIGIGSVICLKAKTMERAGLWGAVISCVSAFLQIIFFLFFGFPFLAYEILSFTMLVGVGFMFTSASTLSMEEGREYTGAAAAIFGAGGFLFGGVVSPLVGIGNIASTSLIILTICSLVSLMLAWMGRKRRPTT